MNADIELLAVSQGGHVATKMNLGAAKIACIVPTYNGGTQLRRLLESVKKQTIKADLLVVDSSSTDNTREMAVSQGSNVRVIPVEAFNHGGTRQMMVDLHPKYEVYVFLTQDAYLEEEQALEHLLQPFCDDDVGAVCGRQLPHFDANPFATHARVFNYPDVSSIKSFGDVPAFGIKTAFISNSFAAYRRKALVEIGGFPRHVILSEDMYVTGKMLLKGWKVAYAGDALCRHSHNYTIGEEFRRYFDIGVFHGREAWIRCAFGGAGGEGLRYVVSELRFLGFKRFHLWPESLIRNALKLLGYKLGRLERMLPRGAKEHLSMHRTYWRGPNA